MGSAPALGCGFPRPRGKPGGRNRRGGLTSRVHAPELYVGALSRCESSCWSRHNEKRVRLPRPVRHERGEGRGERGAPPMRTVSPLRSASSPQPSPPFRTEEREPEATVLTARTFAKTDSAFRHSNRESQRDSGLQPRVARHELPWECGQEIHNPNGVAARRTHGAATPLGLEKVLLPTQGSSCLATLGWRTQPRWGWPTSGGVGSMPRPSTGRNTRVALMLAGGKPLRCEALCNRPKLFVAMATIAL